MFGDPAYEAAVTKGKGSWSLISPGGVEECRKYVSNITALGQEYRSLLTG